jgi:WD40 repeat protein
LHGGNAGLITAIAFSDSGNELATGTQRGGLNVWNVAGERIFSAVHLDRGIRAIAFAPSGAIFFTHGNDIAIERWKPAESKPVRLLPGPHARAVAFDASSGRLARGCADGTVLISDESGENVICLCAHASAVTALAFGSSGQQIAVGADDGAVSVWDPRDGHRQFAMEGHSDTVTALAFRPQDGVLASASRDGTVGLWDAEGNVTATFEMKVKVECLAFSPNSKYLAAGGENGVLKIWDTATWEIKQSLSAGRSTVLGVSFAPDNQHFATANYDGDVRLWAVGNYSVLRTMESHNDSVSAVAFTPDGKRIVSASRDLKFWDRDSGREVLTMRGHAPGFAAVAFEPKRGDRLVSVDRDGTVLIWDATPLDTGAAPRHAAP